MSPKGFHFSFFSLREASGTSWVLSLTKAQKKKKKETIDKKKKRRKKERKSESKHDFLFSRRRANFYFIVTALRSAAVGLHGRGL